MELSFHKCVQPCETHTNNDLQYFYNCRTIMYVPFQLTTISHRHPMSWFLSPQCLPILYGQNLTVYMLLLLLLNMFEIQIVVHISLFFILLSTITFYEYTAICSSLLLLIDISFVLNVFFFHCVIISHWYTDGQLIVTE